MGRAIAEPTIDNDFFYLCPECDYDLGEKFSNMSDDNCPECDHPIDKYSLTRGSATTSIQLRGLNGGDEEPDDDDEVELPDINDEGEEIRIEQITSGYINYETFCLPYGYQWNDVDSWSMSGDQVYITFESGVEWNTRMHEGNHAYEHTGDFRALDMDGDHLGDY